MKWRHILALGFFHLIYSLCNLSPPQFPHLQNVDNYCLEEVGSPWQRLQIMPGSSSSSTYLFNSHGMELESAFRLQTAVAVVAVLPPGLESCGAHSLACQSCLVGADFSSYPICFAALSSPKEARYDGKTTGLEGRKPVLNLSFNWLRDAREGRDLCPSLIHVENKHLPYLPHRLWQVPEAITEVKAIWKLKRTRQKGIKHLVSLLLFWVGNV